MALKRKNFWQHRNVFITGSTGLLGSWVTKELVDNGANVCVLIRDHVPRSHLFSQELQGKINIVYGNVEDYLLIERILTEYEIDTVLHLAAQTIAPIANRNPLSTFETNIKGTWCVLEACRRTPTLTRIIVASSDKAYGDQETMPYTEDMPLHGEHPYDVSKSCADLIAMTYAKSYNMPICITRCGNLFGPGDLNFNRLLPSVIRSALYNQSPVLRSNGKYIRDFFYVEDAAIAVLTLAEQMDNKKVVGQAFNFGNENRLTVLQMVKIVMKQMHLSIPLTIENNSPNEILVQYLSADKAHKLLKWYPRYTFEEAIEKTIAWYKDFFAKQ